MSSHKLCRKPLNFLTLHLKYTEIELEILRKINVLFWSNKNMFIQCFQLQSKKKICKTVSVSCKFLNQKIVLENFDSFTLSMDNLFIGF